MTLDQLIIEEHGLDHLVDAGERNGITAEEVLRTYDRFMSEYDVENCPHAVDVTYYQERHFVVVMNTSCWIAREIRARKIEERKVDMSGHTKWIGFGDYEPVPTYREAQTGGTP